MVIDPPDNCFPWASYNEKVSKTNRSHIGTNIWHHLIWRLANTHTTACENSQARLVVIAANVASLGVVAMVTNMDIFHAKTTWSILIGVKVAWLLMRGRSGLFFTGSVGDNILKHKI